MTLALAAGVAGCATKAPESVLSEGPRMIDLYRGGGSALEEEAGPVRVAQPERRCRWWLFTWPCAARGQGAPAPEASPEPSYARTAANELEVLFPRLPNPDVFIYVAPHLATESRLPVPGYTTAVPLYDRVEYALPGDAERANDSRTDPGEKP